MTNQSIQSKVNLEVQRTVLREAVTRYRNEMMDHDERMELLDRIRRLRRALGLDTKTGLPLSGNTA